MEIIEKINEYLEEGESAVEKAERRLNEFYKKTGGNADKFVRMVDLRTRRMTQG